MDAIVAKIIFAPLIKATSCKTDNESITQRLTPFQCPKRPVQSATTGVISVVTYRKKNLSG